MAECSDCGVLLTTEEQVYYEIRCEGCERLWADSMEAYRKGAPNQMLDALFNIPFG